MNNKLYIYNFNNDHRTSYFKPPPIEIMKSLGWLCIDFKIEHIKNKILFIDYLKNNNIKIIFCFGLAPFFIDLYGEFLIEKKICLLDYSNDLHNKNNILTEKKKLLIEKKTNFQNLYICANYYYCFDKFNKDTTKTIKYPTFVDDDFNIEFNNDPIKKILLSGSKTSAYPGRKKLNNISGYNNNIQVLKHGIYKGYEYIKYLNQFICCFACCLNSSTPYIVAKFFEIPSSGSLLFAYDKFVKDELKNLGFIDGENYISCDLCNMEEKIKYILDPNNLNEINRIRKNGYDFVWKYHKQSDRLKYIDDYVNKNLLN